MDNRLPLAVALLAGGALGWTSLHQLDGRLAQLEGEPPSENHLQAELLGRLGALQAELDHSRSLLEELRGRGEQAERLGAELRELALQLGQQRREIRAWRDEYTRAVSDSLERRLGRLDELVLEEWERIEADVANASRIAEDAQGRIAELRQAGESDPDLRWRDLLGPTVQLTGSSTVGSGVLLASRPGESEGIWRTEVLTAWHVVRDILPESPGPEHTIPVRVYRQEGGFDEERAALLEYDPRLDVALLRLRTDRRFEHGARLASRSRLERVRTFDRVYAVGCPLGNDPIPTFGEVAETRHEVDGEQYWMISAPTYIGNSGGGIFDAETRQLLGIFSKIYTHGSLRPTVVPHMGLAVPLQRVYDWLESRGLAHLTAQPLAAQTQAASAQVPAASAVQGR